MLMFSSRTLRLKKRYLLYGAGSKFFGLLSPKKGWRSWVERCAFSLFRMPSIRNRSVLQQLQEELGWKVSEFLLFYTGDYKHTSWIGVVQEESHRQSFIKIYKHGGAARTEYEKTKCAEETFSPFFRVAEPRLYSDHILALSVLRKEHNVSVQDVWAQVLQQSVSLYRKEQRPGKWAAYMSWVPQQLRTAPAVLGHGDLSHWNCFVDDQGVLCLIDYEEVDWYPPMYDCFHLLLKPTLLHRPADIPLDECVELSQTCACSFEQVLVWLCIYLECENEKDRTRNTLLQSKHIEKTIHNRQVLHEGCKKHLLDAVQKQ